MGRHGALHHWRFAGVLDGCKWQFEVVGEIFELELQHRKLHGRARITNGKALLPGIDGRSPWVRRCRDVIEAHIADLGGVDNCSAAERSIVRRASVLTVELERLEAKFAAAGQADIEELDCYARIASNLRRLLESVGLQRRAKDIGPTLGDLLQADMIKQQRENAERAERKRQDFEQQQG
jgi:hypothetical protein